VEVEPAEHDAAMTISRVCFDPKRIVFGEGIDEDPCGARLQIDPGDPPRRENRVHDALDLGIVDVIQRFDEDGCDLVRSGFRAPDPET
jgi:hypothetical protein